MNSSLRDIYQRIKTRQHILLLSHQKPDGDAVGSMMALAKIITNIGIKVDILTDDIPEHISKIGLLDVKVQSEEEYDLIIIVDTSSKNQLGNYESYYDKKDILIIIDHHNNDHNDEIMHYIDNTASSATVLIYRFIKENNLEIDHDIARFLYMGLITDTHNFVHNNTNKEAFLVAAELLDYGIDSNNLYYSLVEPEYDMNYLMLTKLVVENMEFINNKIVFSYLDYESIKKQPFDMPKILVNLGYHLKNAVVSIIIIEEDINKYRVSLRSKENFDVSLIAKMFGGGGHKFASGFRFNENFEAVKSELLNVIKEKLKEKED